MASKASDKGYCQPAESALNTARTHETQKQSLQCCLCGVPVCMD